MAEPLFLDEDSPFAEYHRQDEQQQRQPSPTPSPLPILRKRSATEEQAALNPQDDELFELSARMPPPPPRRPSYSSTSSPRNSSRPQSVTSVASSSMPAPPTLPIGTAGMPSGSTPAVRQRSRANSATKRKSPHRNSESMRDLDRGRGSRSADALEVAASIPRQVSPLPSEARPAAPPVETPAPTALRSGQAVISASSQVKSTSHPSQPSQSTRSSTSARLSHSVAEFFHDLYRAIVMVFSFLLSSFTSILPFGTKVHAAPFPLPSSASTEGPSADASASKGKQSGSLAERFKYVVCTSFLLTPSMSISFYDENQAASQGEALGTDVGADSHVPVAKDVVIYSVGLPSTPLPSLHPSHGTRSPPRQLSALQLTPSGARLQRAFVLSLMVLAPLASDWEVWFRTSLALACVVLTVLLTPGAGFLSTERPDLLSYTLDTEPLLVPPPEGSRAEDLLRNAVPGVLRTKQKNALADEIVAQAHALIKAAQALDRGVSGAITAIKEVELVSRGYKLTKPMPPISRIEASASAPPSIGPHGTARDPMRLSISPGLTPLSRSGITSPIPGGSRSPAPPPAEARRVASLRKVLVHTFESADHACRLARQRLEPLADKEEMGLLRTMYSLDGAGEEDVSGEAASRQTHDEGDLGTLELLHGRNASGGQLAKARREAGESIGGSTPPSSYHPPSTLPRNFGSKRNSRNFALGGESLLSDAPESSRSVNGPKRLSLLSDLSASDRERLAAAGRTSPRPPGSQGFGAGEAAGSRLSRLQYKVSDSTSGPNDSAAAKRASYTSSTSFSYVPSPAKENRFSVTASRPTSPSGPPIGSSSFSLESHARQAPLPSGFPSSPVGSSINGTASTAAGGTYGGGGSATPSSRPTSFSLSGDRKHLSSNLSSLNVFGSPRADDPISSSPAGDRRGSFTPQQPYDAFTLLSLQSAFEGLHSERRQALVPLLALDLSLNDSVLLGGPAAEDTKSTSVSLTEYWDEALSIMAALETALHEERTRVEVAVREAMGLAPVTKGGGRASDDGARLGDVAGVVHPGLEGCVAAMGTSLRTVQAKLVACAEACRIQAPELLHGDMPSAAVLADVSNTERLFDSMREDLLALCAEWESGVKMLRVARIRAAADADRSSASSPTAMQGVDGEWAAWTKAAGAPSVDSSGKPVAGLGSTPVSTTSTLRQSDSTMTSSESDSPRDLREGEAPRNVMYGDDGADVKTPDVGSKDYAADGELQNLLLNSTSPAHLPPAGLEQIFESAALPAAAAAPRSNLSREERIRVLKEQRAAESARQSEARQKATIEEQGMGVPPVQMVRELEDVMRVLRAKRESLMSVGASSSGDGSTSPLQVDQPLGDAANRLFGRTSPHPHSLDVVAESRTEGEDVLARPNGRTRASTASTSPTPEERSPGGVRASTGSIQKRPLASASSDASLQGDSNAATIAAYGLPPFRPRPRSTTSNHSNRLSVALNGQVWTANGAAAAATGSSGHSASSTHSPSASVSLSEAATSAAAAGRNASISRKRASKGWPALGGLAEERTESVPTAAEKGVAI